MFRNLLTGTALALILLTGSLPALAQAQPKDSVETVAPASEATDFTQADLEKFANAWVRIRIIQEQAKDQLGQILLSQEWEQARLEAIANAQSSEKPLEPALTPEETKKLAELEAKASQIGEKASAAMQQVVLDQGLELQEFEAILASAQQDKAIKDQLKPLIQNAVKALQSGG